MLAFASANEAVLWCLLVSCNAMLPAHRAMEAGFSRLALSAWKEFTCRDLAAL